VEALREVEPGMSEYDMEAITEEGLLRRGILPSVALYAVDERIFKYKHAVPRGRRLKQYGMLNLCSRKWGLAISITRFIYFGALPEELAARFNSAARVNAALLNATRVGATSAQLFKVAAAAYATEGYPGEERFHHQAGPLDMASANGWQRPREPRWLSIARPLHGIRAFAGQGGGYGDSARRQHRKPHRHPELPVLSEAIVEGSTYAAAGVLVK